MASDIPPFLDVGTPVSAKFKGAFCEATIKQIKKNVKCKILSKEDCRSFVVSHDDIVGDIEVNSVVCVRDHADGGKIKEGILQRMTDHSVYTVVFDDGDERTLKRTNVCVMGEKHFNEHENLDNLPLTDPENFLSPVLVGASEKRRKRNKSLTTAALAQNDAVCEDSDSEKSSALRSVEIEKEFVGKVVCIEQGERKKSWFPALGMKNVGLKQHQVCVQSFKDGKKMFVHKDDVKEFHKDKEPLASYFKGELKIEPILRASIDKALAYNDLGELPKGWNVLDTIDEKDSSDEDSLLMLSGAGGNSKTFSEMVSAFMAHQGSPISKPPQVNNQPVDLLQLYECVADYGGCDEVTNQQWRGIYTKLGLQNMNSAVPVSMKYMYKKYLGPYEAHMKKYAKGSPGRLGRFGSLKKGGKDEGNDSVKSGSDSEESEHRPSTRAYKGDQFLPPEDKCVPSSSKTTPFGDISSVESRSKEFPDQDVYTKSEGDEADVVNSPHSSLTSDDNDSRIVIADGKPQVGKFKPGARIAVHYGSGANHRLYNAKILDVEKEKNGDIVYYVHYNGWNHRYDEWIKEERINGQSSNIPSKRKNGQPPTPLSRIRKDPPKKYQSQMVESSTYAMSLYPPTKRDVYTSRAVTSSRVVSTSKHHHLTADKPSSSSPRRSPIYISERISDLNKAKQTHRPKPVNEVLLIPDIKPSPVKPRMTRNSMQDALLLNALEESIGKPNIKKESVLKSDPLLPVSKKRRTNDAFSKVADDDVSHEDEKESDNAAAMKKNKKLMKNSLIDFDPEGDKKKSLSSFDPKESSKTETVKKWIEDSNKILSKDNGMVVKKEEEDESPDVEVMLMDDDLSKHNEASLTTLRKMAEDDADSVDCDVAFKSEHVTNACSDSNQTSDLVKEECASPKSYMLNDFCNIIDNVQKLKPTDVKEDAALSFNNTAGNSTTNNANKSPRKHKKNTKCKSLNSSDPAYKSPSSCKKDTACSSAPLEYNIDFMSDLSTLLADKDASQRISIMQTKMNDMRTLYCKLRSEVANIDRRRRRKLRKQAERQRKDSS